MGSDKKQWRGGIISIFLGLLQEPNAPPFPQSSFRKATVFRPSVWPSSEFT